MTGFEKHPSEPYYAVIFTTQRTNQDQKGYIEMAEDMEALAQKQDGFLGIESARKENGVGITVSYWRDEKALKAWKQVAEHKLAQKMGQEKWYQWYHLRVAKVERGYSFKRDE